jgi:transposase
MPKYRTVTLTDEDKAELTKLRNQADKPYLRERASAILQVADGRSARWVALNGLLQSRQPDTIYGWLDRYEESGTAGLIIRDGRGRTPAYEP